MAHITTLSAFGFILLLVTVVATEMFETDMPPAPVSSEKNSSRPAVALTRRYQTTLTTDQANAWQARKELETRLAMIESTVALHGGELRRGQTHYRRLLATSQGDRRHTGMIIEQVITVTLPAGTAWTQLRNDLIHLGSAPAGGNANGELFTAFEARAADHSLK